MWTAIPFCSTVQTSRGEQLQYISIEGQVQQSYEAYHLRVQCAHIQQSHVNEAAGAGGVGVCVCVCTVVHFKGTAGLADLLIILFYKQ